MEFVWGLHISIEIIITITTTVDVTIGKIYDFLKNKKLDCVPKIIAFILCKSLRYRLNVFLKGHNWNSKSTGESIQIPDVMWGWKEPNGGHEHNVMMKDGILADIRNDYNCLPICEITRKEITSSS